MAMLNWLKPYVNLIFFHVQSDNILYALFLKAVILVLYSSLDNSTRLPSQIIHQAIPCQPASAATDTERQRHVLYRQLLS